MKDKQYIGSQQHWEDSINADYDYMEQMAKDMQPKNPREEEYIEQKTLTMPDKNKNLVEQTVYVPVSVESRLPDDAGRYHVIIDGVKDSVVWSGQRFEVSEHLRPYLTEWLQPRTGCLLTREELEQEKSAYADGFAEWIAGSGFTYEDHVFEWCKFNGFGNPQTCKTTAQLRQLYNEFLNNLK